MADLTFVADTHALLWHLFDRRRLGASAAAAFSTVDSGSAHVGIPAFVLAEMIAVVERGRLGAVTVAQLLADLALIEASANYHLLPLLPETVIASHSLIVLRDIFDRLSVAEARRLGVPLITLDKNITSAGLVTTMW